MAAELFLPPQLEDLDLGDSLDQPAATLRVTPPGWLDPRYPAADRALRYGRGHGGLTYEEIAERTLAALPAVPKTAIATRASARRERQRDEAHRRRSDVDALIEQIVPLRHRSLDLLHVQRLSARFEVGDDYMLLIEDEGGGEEPWMFSLAHPPRILLRETVPAPAVLLATQHGSVSLPGVFWLPFMAVVERGEFPRFQSTRDRLQQTTKAGCVFLFLSHRWLARSEPDPANVQARFFAWQLFAAVCEAVDLVGDRGLRQPRRASKLLNTPVGRFGSELAESLVVNLLQPGMDDQEVEAGVSEVSTCRAELEDRGSAIADQDKGLRRLQERLQSMPVLRRLLEKVFVWYDYSCLPQSPRSAEDESLFRDGLAHLNHAQLIAATAILLDEIDDYLGRAWCVLEAITAESLTALTGARAFQLPASRRSTNRSGRAERYNQLLLHDSTHLVWRALLDTEVFGRQTPERCMKRLSLAATDPSDLPFLYEALRRMQAPDAPGDDLEVVTGFFPLPFAPDSASVYWRTNTDRNVIDTPAPVLTADLDWTPALRLQDFREAAGERRPMGVPPLTCLLANQEALLEPEALDGLHLAVVGSCEGEATLLARWVRERHGDLEKLLGLRPVSISWLASDIVPAGVLPYAALHPWPCFSYRWIVISTAARLAYCEVKGHLIEMMRALGRPYGELAVDRANRNFRWYEGRQISEQCDVAAYPIVEGVFRTHRGGLFKRALLPYLLPARMRATA